MLGVDGYAYMLVSWCTMCNSAKQHANSPDGYAYIKHTNHVTTYCMYMLFS